MTGSIGAKVGLTGGIGSGKSTVSNLFGQLGIRTVDADQITRQLMQPGTAEYSRIVELFGDEIVDGAGNIARSKLGDIVFSDPGKRKSLESILHPSVRKSMFTQCQQSNSVYCILEIPLLIESGQYKEMDQVLVVTCQTENRKLRLQRDRNMNLGLINSILGAQISDQERILYANDVIANDTSIDELGKQVKNLHKKYLNMFS